MNILIVEDDSKIAALINTCIAADGHQCSITESGEEGLALCKEIQPDAVFLDIGLPDVNGIEVCTRIRQLPHINPLILMLTARRSDTDRIIGYVSGADDYIEKPFNPHELPVRLRAVARRSTSSSTRPSDPHGSALLQTSHFSLDREKHRVTVQASTNEYQVLRLSPVEFQLFYLLVSRPGRIWSRGELLDNVRGIDFVGDERSVDSYIKRIRSKIPCYRRDQYIKTHVGVGYSFEDSE